MNHPAVCLLLVTLTGPSTGAIADGPDAAAPLDQRIAMAESSLREGEYQVAESHYRDALLEGWLVMGTLARVQGRPEEARDALRRASQSAVENRRALQALALAQLQTGEAATAVEILRGLARSRPADIQSRRLLAEVLAASGHRDESVQELEDARASAPGDVELLFALADGYLGAKRVDDAARLFAQLIEARPIARTRVLVGRTYRDFGAYDRARAELQAALRQDSRVRRAHYYLGSVTVAEKGRAGLEEAIPEFQAELKLAPEDPLANLELGMALVDTQRPAEALPALEIAARVEPMDPRTLYYLGRAQLGVERPTEAAVSLKRALELAQGYGATGEQLRVMHNQLGQALRALGDAAGAAAQFAEAQRLSAQGSLASREQLARHMAGAPEPESALTPAVSLIESSPLATLTPAERLELQRRVTAALARTYVNLGVMLARGERFARAAEQLEKAAELDANFPQVQSSLGVAYFNARQFGKAAVPLSRALRASPQDPGLKRMLAMAWLNTQAYAKAAELLRDDPELDTDPSLRFAYGLALVKSGQTAEAEAVFSRLLRLQGDSAELSVLLGKAYAQMGDFDSAIASFQRALELQANVPEAHAALGVIYLKQGRMAEAEAALRKELTLRPADLQSQQNLAYLLDSEQRPEEALPLLRGVLQAQPDFADARYLLGKILLAQGATAQAVEHLEAAARLAPEDANAHYQLGRAYTKLGRSEDAQHQFEVFRQIKAKR